MSVMAIGVGILLLLLGRRMFWVFVAGTGFAVGVLLSVELLGGQSDWVMLVVVIGLGALGALVALMAQKVAVGIGGFLAGAYLGHALATALQFAMPIWVPVIVGGILGAILLAVLFDWALIALSSLLGAAVISKNVPLTDPWPALLFIGLLVVGLAIQSRQFRRMKSPSRPKAE